jgi:hypothetical protein
VVPNKTRARARPRGEWVLAIDADERLTPELARSIRAVVDAPRSVANGYSMSFLATWCGKPVRFGDWGGKRHLRLFRRAAARFTNVQVHERVVCEPPHGELDGILVHDTVASNEEALQKMRRYAELGGSALAARGRGGFASASLHAAWTLLRGLLLKGGFLDGVVGWKVAWTNTQGTWLRYCLAGRLLERRAAERAPQPAASGWRRFGRTAAPYVKLSIVVLLMLIVPDN